MVDQPERLADPFPPEGESMEDDTFLNAMLEFGAFQLGLCKYGGPDHWSVKFSDAIWNPCECCHVLRGTAIGFLAGFLPMLALIAVII